MNVLQTDHPPGAIGISTSGYGWRNGTSVMAIMGCWKPEGTRVLNAESIDIPDNMNKIIRALLADERASWLWIQSDDHRFGGMALKQLLDREVDVVVPLILRRGPPFVPLAFRELVDAGYVPFAYDELPESGLVECELAATGGMLIRRQVLEVIPDPWFEYEQGTILNEDFVFARKIKAAGFSIHLDVDVVMGHIGTYTIWPHRNGNGWQIGFDMGESKSGRRSTFYFDPHEDMKEVTNDG